MSESQCPGVQLQREAVQCWYETPVFSVEYQHINYSGRLRNEGLHIMFCSSMTFSLFKCWNKHVSLSCSKYSTLMSNSAAQSFIARLVTYLYLSILICRSPGNDWLHIYPTKRHTSVNSTLQNIHAQISVEFSHVLHLIKINATYVCIAKKLLQKVHLKNI